MVNRITKKTLWALSWMLFNCLMASRAISRTWFTFSHYVSRNSWYSFHQPWKDERLSLPWSYWPNFYHIIFLIYWQNVIWYFIFQKTSPYFTWGCADDLTCRLKKTLYCSDENDCYESSSAALTGIFFC